MTFVQLRPDGDYSYSGTGVSGINSPLYSNLNDNSDSTYVGLFGSVAPFGAKYYVAGIASTTLPAGAVPKYVQGIARLRVNAVTWGGTPTQPVYVIDSMIANGFYTLTYDGITIADYASLGSTGAFQNYYGAAWAGVVAPSQAQNFVDNLLFEIQTWPGFGSSNDNASFDVSEVYVYLTYATVPVAAVSAPSGSITTTTTPTMTWSHTPGVDGDVQSQYQVRVFTAAQYGIGGFDPGSSPATYDSSIVYGAASSLVLPSLTNGTTYRAYVQTAQSINGAPHFSAWAFSGFSISVTAPVITSVTNTPNNAGGYNSVAVVRSGSAPVATTFDLQRSVDGGTTWQYVRGGLNAPVTGATNTVLDYEIGNTVSVQYRARGTYILTGSTITGAWVTSSTGTGWTSTDLWLKDLFAPANNMIINNILMPEPTYARPQGVFSVIGATFPVVVTDVLQAGVSSITFETYTLADYVKVKALAAGTALMLHAPVFSGFSQWGSRYVTPGNLAETHISQEVALDWFVWQLGLTEIAIPAITS